MRSSLYNNSGSYCPCFPNGVDEWCASVSHFYQRVLLGSRVNSFESHMVSVYGMEYLDHLGHKMDYLGSIR